MFSKLIFMVILSFSMVFGNSNIELEQKRYGEHLFNGNFNNSKNVYSFDDYEIQKNDEINLQIWGNFEFSKKMTVDNQGNIFLPEVGPVKVVGIKNMNLNEHLNKVLKNHFKKSVHLYANLDTFQEINVFVTGEVNNPGLYSGFSNNDIIQFIDKAKGIKENGSYRTVSLIRNNKVINTVDLYTFVNDGFNKKIFLKNGDTILVKSKNDIVYLETKSKVLEFELLNEKYIDDILNYVYIDKKYNMILLSNDTESKTIDRIKNKNIIISNNDNLKFYQDYLTKNIAVHFSGEHDDKKKFVVNKNISLENFMEDKKLNSLSNPEEITIYRESLALKEKELLDNKIAKIEEMLLTQSSLSKEDAQIKEQEIKSYLTFIDRVKNIKPKGKIILDNSNYSDILLEDNDEIFVPKKSNLVLVQGEVYFPTTHIFNVEYSLSDYINKSGGFKDNADESHILLIHSNGVVEKYDNSMFADSNIQPGDSILILPEIKSSNIQISKSISEIIYHIAVSTGVLLGL